MKPDQVFGFENAGWPALLIDKATTILRSNASALKTFGTEILGGAKFSVVWSPENPWSPEDFLQKWERQPASSNVLKFNVRGVHVSYTTVICALQQDSQTFFVFQLFPDLGSGLGNSESPPIEGTLQKQRLDVAINLARSIALDFRNALTGVLGHSSLLLGQAEPDHPWRKSLEQIEKAVAKGADAADSLGSFSRQVREQQGPGSGNINFTIQKATESLKERAVQQSVQWEFQLERMLYTARFDEARVRQAFVKIIENAIEALPSGGLVRFSTKNLVLSNPTQDRTAKLPAGSYVCVEISDNGQGIGHELLPRVFEPFFTTKASSKHRGLGLPWVYGIITNLGGAVAISSEPGSGTSVRIYFPAEHQYVSETSHVVGDLAGTETVLLVDDEEIIVSMGQTVLSTYGYKVVAASSGKKALDILAKGEPKIDLLVTDLVMPGMSGTELVEQANKLFPNLPVLIMSGALPPGERSNKGYLHKPFASQDLLRKVRLLLGKRPEA